MNINYELEQDPLFQKNGISYFQLPNGIVYCAPLDQSNKVGGTGESQRNSIHNPVRLERIKHINPEAKILDYGCGSGIFVDFLKVRGMDVLGYDKYSNEFNYEIKKDYFDVVTMIEVIEHISSPFKEIDEVYFALKNDGVLMIETSFTDWMDSEDPYINPLIGHCTIFSHRGLDELMISKGFIPLEHINMNVRLYKKVSSTLKLYDQRGEELWSSSQSKKLTLITMGQGNPVALKRTLESFKNTVSEVIFGDLLIFDADREIIKTYQNEYKLKIVPFPFNFIFKNGFSEILNTLSEYATNDFVVYMNIGEVLDGEFDILNKLDYRYNCYYLNHAVETHHWYRLYNRKEMVWSGIIHEQIAGLVPPRPYPTQIYQFADTEKDLPDEFYAKVMNTVKELTYWQQYIKLVEQPDIIAETNIGWVTYAKDSYDILKERMQKKGTQYEAFLEGDLQKFIDYIFSSDDFKDENQESTTLVNLQGKRKDIL